MSVRLVPVSVQEIYSLFALFLSIVKKYLPVGRATQSSSVAVARVPVVAQTDHFAVGEVLKSATIFPSDVAIFIY